MRFSARGDARPTVVKICLSAGICSKAIRKAQALYADKPLLRHYQRNGMARDFSWDRTAAAYAALYERFGS